MKWILAGVLIVGLLIATFFLSMSIWIIIETITDGFKKY